MTQKDCDNFDKNIRAAVKRALDYGPLSCTYFNCGVDGHNVRFCFAFDTYQYVCPSIVISCTIIFKDGKTKSVSRDVMAIDYGQKLICHFATSIICKRIALIRKELKKIEGTNTADSNSEKDDQCRDTKATC